MVHNLMTQLHTEQEARPLSAMQCEIAKPPEFCSNYKAKSGGTRMKAALGQRSISREAFTQPCQLSQAICMLLTILHDACP